MAAPRAPGGAPATTAAKVKAPLPPNVSTKLFISNCPKDITDSDVMDIFSAYRDSVCNITWAHDDEKGFTGYGWVDFNNLESSARAQTQNGYHLRGHDIIISFSQPKRAMDEDPPCEHKEWADWKRLRQKNGLQHFVCIHCGAKWKRATNARKENENQKQDQQPPPQHKGQQNISYTHGQHFANTPANIHSPVYSNNQSVPHNQKNMNRRRQNQNQQYQQIPSYQHHQNQPFHLVQQSHQHQYHNQQTPQLHPHPTYDYSAAPVNLWSNVPKAPPPPISVPSQQIGHHFKRVITDSIPGPPSPIRSEFHRSVAKDPVRQAQNAPLSPPRRPGAQLNAVGPNQTEFIFKDQGAPFKLSAFAPTEFSPPDSPSYNQNYRPYISSPVSSSGDIHHMARFPPGPAVIPSPASISSPVSHAIHSPGGRPIHSPGGRGNPASAGVIITVRTRPDGGNTPIKSHTPNRGNQNSFPKLPKASPQFEVQWIREEFVRLQHKVREFSTNPIPDTSLGEKIVHYGKIDEGYAKLIEEANLLLSCLANMYMGMTPPDSPWHKEMVALLHQIQAEAWQNK